jgi:hypothetical protein
MLIFHKIPFSTITIFIILKLFGVFFIEEMVRLLDFYFLIYLKNKDDSKEFITTND